MAMDIGKSSQTASRHSFINPYFNFTVPLTGHATEKRYSESELRHRAAEQI
jgi:hypothetical protein